MSAADMARERFELLMVMEGTNEISSMTFQVMMRIMMTMIIILMKRIEKTMDF